MYNYYQPQQQYQQSFQRQQLLKGRPVTSLEEVKATSVDFDGSIFYFPDLANNRIYTKSINLDGTASLCMYELKPIQSEITTDYVTRNEFNSAIEKIQQLFNPQSKAPIDEKKSQIDINKF